MAYYLGDSATISNYYAQNNLYEGYIDNNRVVFDDEHLIANESITFTGTTRMVSSDGTSYPTYVVFEAPNIYFESTISIRGVAGKNSLTFNNSSVNFDSATYNETEYSGIKRYVGPISFTGNSSINITNNSNGKTLIIATTLTGTVSLDVDDDVQDGMTFNIKATDNQLVITDGDWTATPSTVGNVTTYTLAKVGPSIKQRLFYTYENGQKVLRFLRSGL